MSLQNNSLRQDGAPPGIGHNNPPAGVLADYLTPEQCADELDIRPRTLQRWHRLGEGPPRTLIGRRVFFHRESLARWVRAHEQEEI